MRLKEYANPAVIGTPAFIEQVYRIRTEDKREIEALSNRTLRGRLRSGVRSTPPTAVEDDDREGDVVTSATDIYWCLNFGGTLKWAKITPDSFIV